MAYVLVSKDSSMQHKTVFTNNAMLHKTVSSNKAGYREVFGKMISYFSMTFITCSGKVNFDIILC